MDLTDYIKRSGVTRAEICRSAGISRAMLSLIETGKRRIGADRAAAFARAIGAPLRVVRPDLSELFDQSHPANSAPSIESCHVQTSKAS